MVTLPQQDGDENGSGGGNASGNARCYRKAIYLIF
jgi:hypothetical protein